MDIINLYIEYSDSPYSKRKNEIINSITQNLSLKFISNYYIFAENFNWLINTDTRIHKIDIKERCTFSYLIDFSNKMSVNSINILINNDIILTNTFESIKISDDDFYAISRFESIKDANPFEYKTGWSQDVWVWFGYNKIPISKLNFYLGILGCDNRLLYEASKYYKYVKNPAYTYRCIHNHKSNIRNKRDRIGPPYKLIKPSRLY